MDVFIYRVLAAALVGGGFLALSSYVAERVKPELGGLINSIPTTMLIAVVFITLTVGASEAANGTVALLMGVGANAGVTLFYNYLIKKNQKIVHATLLSAIVWGGITLIMLYVNNDRQFMISLLFATGATALLTYFVTIKNRSFEKVLPSKKKKIVYLTRLALGGGIIGGIVYLSHELGGFWGGLIGGLPIMTLTGIGFVYRSQGAKITQQFIRTFSIGAWSNIIFLAVVNVTLSLADPLIAILGSYVVSIAGAVVAYAVFNKKLQPTFKK